MPSHLAQATHLIYPLLNVYNVGYSCVACLPVGPRRLRRARHKQQEKPEGEASMRRGTIGATAVAGIFAALTGAAMPGTDSYPDRPIKVVVPAAAGGVTDTPARIVTNRMRDNLGQTFVVENQGGAGGILAPKASSARRLTDTRCFTSTPPPTACCRR